MLRFDETLKASLLGFMRSRLFISFMKDSDQDIETVDIKKEE